MKAVLNLLVLVLIIGSTLKAQENQIISMDSLNKSLTAIKKDVDVLKRLKVNGWIQAQYQHADSAGVANLDGGDLPANVDSRFMIRRGRIKFTYENGNVQYVAQLNMTERFINVSDIYGKITDPYIKWVSLQAGIMNRPFGYDIQMSSADRESPERSRYTQLLTPNERDMGAEIIIEAPKKSKLNGLKIVAGLFNGTGLTIPTVNISDIDSKKDFIGRICYYKSINHDKIKYGVGASNYYGYERVANNMLFTQVGVNPLGDNEYVAADSTKKTIKGTYAKRIYYGVEGLFSVKSVIGTTTIRGEYVFGQQPGSSSSNKSPQAATTGATYIRNFNGFYGYFIQRIAKTKHEVVLKYEWIDPNTSVSNDKINSAYRFSGADVKYTAIGLGYNCYINENFKLMLHYNMVTNELSKNLSGFTREIPDNIFTARVQIRF